MLQAAGRGRAWRLVLGLLSLAAQKLLPIAAEASLRLRRRARAAKCRTAVGHVTQTQKLRQMQRAGLVAFNAGLAALAVAFQQVFG